MKTITACLVAVAVVLFLGGCVVTSIYPYYTEKDLAFDPALLGHWTNGKVAEEHWRFEKEGTNVYSLTYISDSQTNVMQARLFKLQNERFLDLFNPDDKFERLPPPVPSHLLLRILETSPKVRMAALSHDWLATFLQEQPKAIRHEILKDAKDENTRVVLTADTPELQKFILRHLKTDKAWEDAFELKKD